MLYKIAETLQTNPKAHENLTTALSTLADNETYSNERCDRRQHLMSLLRDFSQGYSGGNDTLREKGMVWDGHCYKRPS